MITVVKSLSHQFGPARDQGARPTCMTFAASDSHAAGRNDWHPLSVEYLCHFAGDASAGITKGIALKDALFALESQGQPVENDYPYLPGGPTSGPPTIPAERLFRCSGVQMTPSLDDVIKPIESDRPVLIVMSISDAFYLPDSNAYISSTEPVDVSRIHAVIGTAIGEANGRTCIQIRNSWGMGWGDQGYSWIDADYLEVRLYQTAILDVGAQNGVLAA